MTDVWNGIAEEFLHLYPRGTRTLAVAGSDAERSRFAADELAAALSTLGHGVERAHVADVDATTLRTDTVAPFRAQAEGDRVLIVSGPAALLAENARGVWNFTLWQLAGDEPPHSVASALVDLTDPAHPTRRTADYCALPAAYGA
ncbi:MAG: hypothetical protein P0Y60_15375 [Candidatus Microbacterium colombiense]|nr:MAG: hypothetical protein P0Y60_15375 [Microbacterium sp.]